MSGPVDEVGILSHGLGVVPDDDVADVEITILTSTHHVDDSDG